MTGPATDRPLTADERASIAFGAGALHIFAEIMRRSEIMRERAPVVRRLSDSLATIAGGAVEPGWLNVDEDSDAGRLLRQLARELDL
jgi:hypothetical protein